MDHLLNFVSELSQVKNSRIEKEMVHGDYSWAKFLTQHAAKSQ